MATADLLPHWACVAFSARCAEHVLPLFDDVWPQCTEKHRTTLFTAIRAARESASNGKLISNYQAVDFAITTLAGALALRAEGLLGEEAESYPANPDDCRLASNIATVFAKTSETALAKPGESYEFAMDGFGWAIEAAVNNQQLIDRINDELHQLRDCAATDRWNHKTCVAWNGTGWTGTKPNYRWWRLWPRG